MSSAGRSDAQPPGRETIRKSNGDCGRRRTESWRLGAHERLYRSPQVDDRTGRIFADVCQDLQESTPNCSVAFDAPEPLLLNTDRAVSVALVVTELVANAAKHAYPNDTRCGIWVRLTHRDHEARVSVNDEGAGLPPNFDIDKTVGLGMRLVKALAKSTKGELRIERRTPGTEFVLKIPLSSDEVAPGR